MIDTYISPYISNLISLCRSISEESKRSMIPSPFLNAPRRNIPQCSRDRKRFFNIRTADVVPEQFKSKIRFNLSSIPIPKPVEVTPEKELVLPDEEPPERIETLDEGTPQKRLIDREKVFGGLTRGLEIEIPFRKNQKDDFGR